MPSIIEELYYNYAEYASTQVENNPLLAAAWEEVRECAARLKETLSAADKDLFDRYCTAQSEIEGINRRDAYAHALQFGVLLMSELTLKPFHTVDCYPR